MSSAAAFAGWAAAGVSAATMLAVRRAVGSRMEAVARACHELRGPLTAARLGLSLGERSGELSIERLRAIDAELGRATLALQDLHDAGRSGPRMRELERIDVQALLAGCVRAAEGLADAHEVTIQMSWEGPEVAIWGDPLRLAQALGNLLANAIEHGGGRVRAHASAGETVVRIEVSDQGPGLPASVAELVRRPRRGRGARGRGLAIASSIAAAHGGRVATAPTTAGACVVLEVPVTDRP